MAGEVRRSRRYFGNCSPHNENEGGKWVAGVTLVEQSSFQSFSMPLRLPGNGDSPKYRAFTEVVKINIDGSGGSQVLIKIPATASTF